MPPRRPSRDALPLLLLLLLALAAGDSWAAPSQQALRGRGAPEVLATTESGGRSIPHCPPDSGRPGGGAGPMNVNHLHPRDIKVVMALGDSITAAFGVHGLTGGLTEVRGASWSVGADPGAVTVANLLKSYSPKIWGGSVGEHAVEVCYGSFCPSSHQPLLDRLNAAQSGAKAKNLVDQVLYLEKELWSSPEVSMEDWKHATVLVGANDVCAMCGAGKGEPGIDLDAFEVDLRRTLSEIRLRIPRVLVVPMFNVSQVYDLTVNRTWCRGVHRTLSIECECAFWPIAKDGERYRQQMDLAAFGVRERTARVVSEVRHMSAGDDGFAVVLQPALSGTDFLSGGFDVSDLSDLDCFHPGPTAHRYMAVALWNNLLTPARTKKAYVDPADVALCANATSVLHTF